MALAICASGQTRIHNEQREQFYESLEALFGEHKYHLFGHTWDDQELPNDVENIVVTDQNDVWENIVRNPNEPKTGNGWFGAMIYDKRWLDNPEYNAVLDGEGDMHAFVKKIIIGLYSALVSNWHAVNLPQSSETVFDCYFKIRWDLILSGEFNKQIWRDNLNRFIDGGKMFPPKRVMTHGNTIIRPEGSAYVNDLIFAFNNKAADAINNNNIYDSLLEMNEAGILKYHTHDLWTTYFKHLGINIVVGYPTEPVSMNRGSFEPGKSFNKEWYI